MKIILASTSPNRQELLDRMGFHFHREDPDYEEVIDPSAPAEAQVQEFALGKAQSVFHQFESEENVMIMGFDSMTQCEGKSLGKPKTKKAAFEMIQSFVGKPQQIITGVGLVGNWKGKPFEKVAAESTSVQFRSDITNCQIRRYLDFGDWQGKCGAYSILGTGIFFLEPVVGDFQNVVGVPVQMLGNMIREITGKSPVWILEPTDKNSK